MIHDRLITIKFWYQISLLKHMLHAIISLHFILFLGTVTIFFFISLPFIKLITVQVIRLQKRDKTNTNIHDEPEFEPSAMRLKGNNQPTWPLHRQIINKFNFNLNTMIGNSKVIKNNCINIIFL